MIRALYSLCILASKQHGGRTKYADNDEANVLSLDFDESTDTKIVGVSNCNYHRYPRMMAKQADDGVLSRILSLAGKLMAIRWTMCRSTPQPCPERPSYTDFFMAIAFLASSRTKHNKWKVGSCLVTPPPHRLVAMGYNGMPDGCGFKDKHMLWGGDKQRDYSCHSEMNTIIAGFRRNADLSDCTLYVTHSPCDGCSELIAQAGIKNVVYTKDYKGAKSAYDLLDKLPGMNLKKYDYRRQYDDDDTNIAKIRINLATLSVDLETSWKDPEKDPPNVQKGHDQDVDFPLDDYFMSLAVLATTRSPFKEERDGACLVNHEPRRAISVGYNGYPDDLKAESKDEYVCCAELNAIVSAFRYHADLTKCTLYTTGVPCVKCARMIVQSGIKTVVYDGKSANELRMKRGSEEMKGCVEEMTNDAEKLKLGAKKMRDNIVQGEAAATTMEENSIMEKNALIMEENAIIMEDVAKNVETCSKKMKGVPAFMENAIKEMEREAEKMEVKAKQMKEEAVKIEDEAKERAEEMKTAAKKKAKERKEKAEGEAKEKAEEMKTAAKKKAMERKIEAMKIEYKAKKMKEEAEELKKEAKDEAKEMKEKAKEMKEEAEEMKKEAEEMKKEAEEMKKEAEEMKKEAEEMEKEAESKAKERSERKMRREAKKMGIRAKKLEEYLASGILDVAADKMERIMKEYAEEMKEEAKKIFYLAKVAILEYECLTKKTVIEIDLHGKTVKQMAYSVLVDEN